MKYFEAKLLLHVLLHVEWVWRSKSFLYENWVFAQNRCFLLKCQESFRFLNFVQWIFVFGSNSKIYTLAAHAFYSLDDFFFCISLFCLSMERRIYATAGDKFDSTKKKQWGQWGHLRFSAHRLPLWLKKNSDRKDENANRNITLKLHNEDVWYACVGTRYDDC